MQITDRSKDVIKSGGEWISSIEIENIAMGHPQVGMVFLGRCVTHAMALVLSQVAEAAVIGVPDPKWTERPLLVVVPVLPEGVKAPIMGSIWTSAQSETLCKAAALPPSSVLKFLEGKLAKWWMPDGVVCMPSIPHTATGKISKLELRRLLAEWMQGAAGGRRAKL